MSEIMKTRKVDDWLNIYDEAGIPSGPINDVGQVVHHPQVVAREMIVHQEHPVAGSFLMPGIPVKLSKTPGAIEAPAPLLGEHTDLLLKELGYSEDDIHRLKDKGAI